MKALLVADDEIAIENISEVLKSAGYDTISYKWLLKALDNLEEISPHIIVISTGDYPRHWKTLAQYSSAGFKDYKPQIILYTDENFDEEELKKAEALQVRGCFDSVEVEGLDKLREILKKADDIFSGYLTEEEQAEISVDELVPNAKKYVEAEVSGQEEDTFESLTDKVEETNTENTTTIETEELSIEDENTSDKLEELIEDEKAADKLEEMVEDEKAADKLEELVEDEKAADKLEQLSENEDVPTVTEVINEDYDESNETNLPGLDELKELLSENNFEESENDDTINSEEEVTDEESSIATEDSSELQDDSENGDNNMADEQSIEDKLQAIMNANKADAMEKAAELKLDTNQTAVSFVFTNPITLAMVSGKATNYNGVVLEFTPDIPAFILNLSPGTKISVASMKIDDKIENVFAEVMSNDAKKLALAIKK